MALDKIIYYRSIKFHSRLLFIRLELSGLITMFEITLIVSQVLANIPKLS